MSTAVNAHVYAVLILLSIDITYGTFISVPDAHIEILKPKGLRVWIPDNGDIKRFKFRGNLNRPITLLDRIGFRDNTAIMGDTFRISDDKWILENPNLEFKEGDVIYYFIVVFSRWSGLFKASKTLSYTVKAEDILPASTSKPSRAVPLAECKHTATVLRDGKTACHGQVIFEENFDTFREDIWQIEHYIPVNSPDYPFVSYQRLSADPTVSVVEGHLRIAPKLQEREPGFSEDSIYSGSLNLFSGCTASADSCMKEAWGASILPPVVSGKITSKGFAFTYGTVYVRAKLPQGDWLYPEILLEPILKKYGKYNSGIIKIVSARGNRELTKGYTDYSNKVLFGGAVMDFECHNTLLSRRILANAQQWGDDFHLYAVRWAPDRITLSVDGEKWAHMQPAWNGLHGHFPQNCKQLPRTLLSSSTKMAPFDDHFYITLGVGAGSVTEFPDNVQTGGGQPKPWSNPSSKAMFKFWQGKEAWLPTWNQPQLLVDYIKVVAL